MKMKKRNSILYLLNHLERERLLMLPGVGLVLADRIIEARPVSDETLLEIPGMTPGHMRKMTKSVMRLEDELMDRGFFE